MIPPLSNRGGNSPSREPLPQDATISQSGESGLSPSGCSRTVIVDWCSVVFPGASVGPQGDFLGGVRRLFDGTVTQFRSRPAGVYAYQHSIVSDEGGVLIAWGGNGDSVLLQVPGDGCARVACWATFREFVEQRQGHFTRVDLAYDCIDGEHSIETALALYRAGAFRARGAGIDPKFRQVGNFEFPDGTGRTVYIGRKANGKELCVYEKAKQLNPKIAPDHPMAKWTRWELRLGNKDRVIPLDTITDPVPYFRGGYLALEHLVAGVEASRIPTRKAQERVTVEALTDHAKRSYGPLLGHLRASGVDDRHVVERITREGIPRRLLAPTAAELEARGNYLAQLASQDDRENAHEHFAFLDQVHQLAQEIGAMHPYMDQEHATRAAWQTLAVIENAKVGA